MNYTDVLHACIEKQAALTADAKRMYYDLQKKLVRNFLKPTKTIPLEGMSMITGNLPKATTAQLAKELGSDFAYYKPSLLERLFDPRAKVGRGVVSAYDKANKTIKAVNTNGASLAKQHILPLMRQGTTPVAPDSQAIRAQIRKLLPNATELGRGLKQQGFSSDDISDMIRTGTRVTGMSRDLAAGQLRMNRIVRPADPAGFAKWLAETAPARDAIRTAEPAVGVFSRLYKH
jgi:hypothetical protein